MPLKLPDNLGVQMQSPRDLAKNPTYLFYGKGKTGKTSLAMSASLVKELSPVAIVDFEGSAEVGATRFPDVDVYRTENYAQSKGVLNALLKQPDEYKTVILDPVNSLQVQLKDEIIRMQAVNQPSAKSNNSMGERGMLLSDWDVIWTHMRKVLEAFHAAPFTTIITAHADVTQDDLGRQIIEPLMQGNKSKNEVTRVPSVVGYTSMTQDKETKLAVPTIRFAGGAGLIAGDRFGKLPPVMDNPSMTKIFQAINS